MADFSHLDETGGISMVDVGSKRTTQREAVAVATVRMEPETLTKLIEQAHGAEPPCSSPDIPAG